MKLFGKHIISPDDPVSPLIDKAAGENPFSVPENYFENFQKDIIGKVKHIPQSPKFNIYRWVAFTFVAALITFVSLYIINEYTQSDSENLVYKHELVFNDSNQEVYLETDDVQKTIFIHVNPNMSKEELERLLILFGNNELARENAKTQYTALNCDKIVPDNNGDEDIEEDIETDNNTYSHFRALSYNTGTYAEVFEMVSAEGSLLSWPEDICVERPIMLNAYLGEDFDYKWSTGDETESIRVKETGIFSVTVTAQDNPKEMVSKSILVRYIPVPVLNNEYYFNACVGETVQIDVKQGIDAYKYNWQGVNSTKPMASINQPGKYKVEIQGCRTYLDSFIVIYQHCDLSIPAIISPNNDGFNDAFVVDNLVNYPGTSIEIYNSQKELVFQSEDYQNDWNADGLPDGPYYYLLKFADGISQEGIVNVRRN
ncbi:MAG: hypothetical protein C0592_04200 [Marinilabiliales bacterium]|nr:MAG: hypothetical protein C0592_04200 [Marinilabiliales bacterium]